MNGNSFSYKNVSFESFSIIVTVFPWVIPQDLASAAIYELGVLQNFTSSIHKS